MCQGKDLPRSALGALLVATLLGACRSGETRREKIVRGYPIVTVDRTEAGKTETDVLFSLYHHEAGRGESSTWLLPIYFGGRQETPRSDYDCLLPLYHRTVGADGWRFRSLGLSLERDRVADTLQWKSPYLPFVPGLYEGGASTADHWQRLGIWPLVDLVSFRADRHGPGLDVEILGLLNWRGPGDSLISLGRHGVSEAGDLESTRFLPFYSYALRRAEDGEWGHLWLPPAGWFRTYRPGETHDIVLPWLGDVNRDEAGYGWRALVGLFGGGRRDELSWLRLEPFFSVKEGPTEQEFNVLRMYGYERCESEGLAVTRHKFLEPLGLIESSERHWKQRLAPFYFAGEKGDSSHLALLPFYFQSREADRTFRAGFPLYYELQRDARARGLRLVLPLWWQGWRDEQSYTHLLPLYSHLRSGQKTVDLVGGLLYVRQRREGESWLSSQSLLWPLSELRREPDLWHLRVAPLLWLTERPESRLHLALPFYIHARDRESSHRWVLPAWGHHRRSLPGGGQSEHSFYAGGVLLTHWETDASGGLVESTLHVLGPLAGCRDHVPTGTHHERILPFWWREETPDSDLNLLFPLYFSRSRDLDGGRRHLRLVAGNLWTERRRPGFREWGVLWPLIRYRRSETETRLDAALLAAWSRRRSGAESWRLTPLAYASSRSEEPRPADWLHLVSHQQGEWGHRTAVWPFFRSAESESHSSLSLLACLYRRAEGPAVAGDRYRRDWLLPLYYRYREGPPDEPRHEWELYFPGIHHSSSWSGDRRRLSVLFPLYFSETRGKEGAREDNLLWPVAQLKRSRGLLSGRLFPLASFRLEEGGESRWSLSLLHRNRRLAPQREAGGIWSTDGYLNLRLSQYTRGAASTTVAVQPFLFAYHENEELDSEEWNALGYLGYHWRLADTWRFAYLGLVQGGSDGDAAWWSAFPLVHVHHRKTTPLPPLSLARFFHLLHFSSDADRSRWALLGVVSSGWSSHEDEDYDFRLLHRFVTWTQDGAYREQTIEPLFTREHNAATGKYYHSFGRILYIERREEAGAPVERWILGLPVSG